MLTPFHEDWHVQEGQDLCDHVLDVPALDIAERHTYMANPVEVDSEVGVVAHSQLYRYLLPVLDQVVVDIVAIARLPGRDLAVVGIVDNYNRESLELRAC